MIRILLVGIFLFFFLGVFSPALLVLWVVGKVNPAAKDHASMVLVKGAFRFINVISGVKVTVEGRENLPDCAALYVGNHRSMFDILVTYPYIKGQCGYVAKKELWKVYFLRRWMKNIHCLFLDRENPREGMKTIQQGVEFVKQGYGMFIFPEGTRNHGEVPAEFKEGSLRIAEKSGCPVVPVAISGTSEIFEKHFPAIHRGKVTVSFGKPIDIAAIPRQERKHLGADVRQEIMNMLPENYRETLPAGEEAAPAVNDAEA